MSGGSVRRWKVEIAGLFVFAVAVALPLIMLGWGRAGGPAGPYVLRPHLGRLPPAEPRAGKGLEIPPQAAVLRALKDDEKEYLMRLLLESLEAPEARQDKAAQDAPEGCLRRIRVPVFVTLYAPGGKRLREMAREGNLVESISRASGVLSRRPAFRAQGFSPAKNIRARIDILTGARILSPKQKRHFLLQDHGPPVGLALGGSAEDQLQVFLPADVVDRGVVTHRQMLRALCLQAGVGSDQWRAAGRLLSQIEAVSFVNAPGSTRCLDTPRGLVVEDVTGLLLQRSCRLAADYLLRAQREDGSFAPAYDAAMVTFMGEGTVSLNAAITYALARLSQFRTEESYRAACLESLARISRAVYTTRAEAAAAFVLETQNGEGSAPLDASALTLCALCEFREAAQETGFDDLIERLGDFLLFMQKEDGGFELRYDPREGRRHSNGCSEQQRATASGQAALGLLLAYRELKMPRFLLGASRAIERLTAAHKTDSAGTQQLPPGAPWLMAAIREILPILPVVRHAESALEMAEAASQLQLTASDAPAGDLAGCSLGAPLPALGATAGDVEVLSAGWFVASDLAREEGGLRALKGRLLRAAAQGARYLLQMQVTAENGYYLSEPEKALGGFLERPGSRFISTDSVRRALSALEELARVFPQGLPEK